MKELIVHLFRLFVVKLISQAYCFFERFIYIVANRLKIELNRAEIFELNIKYKKNNKNIAEIFFGDELVID